MHMRWRFFLLVLAVLFTSLAARASITGSISGLVTDPSGALVAGAQVIAIETHTGIRIETHTDSKGFYDNSLLGVTTAPVDTPELTGNGGPYGNTNPRSGLPYVNPNAFTFETIGQVGNANRRYFHGPGLNNWDMALLKNTNFTETKTLQLRLEAFNIFNHAQFINPNGLINVGLPVDGVITSGFVRGGHPSSRSTNSSDWDKVFVLTVVLPVGLRDAR